MKTIIHPTYFPNIAHMSAFVQSELITFEQHDNYQKQTYRNRCAIYGPNGILTLTVPVNYSQKTRQLSKDVRISADYKWQTHHLKSLQTAYRTSPFYEYYEEDLMSIFEKDFKFLMELNLYCLNVILECLQFDLNFKFSDSFEKSIPLKSDRRNLVQPSLKLSDFKPYRQVFDEKHGFINNLSILDLLFNEGPNSLNYLQSLSIE